MPNNTFTFDKIPFTQIPNSILTDPRIKLREMGMYCYIRSKVQMKPDWKFSAARMAKEMGDGERSIHSSLNKLIEAGYIERKHNRDGTIQYHIYNKSQTWKKPFSRKSGTLQKRNAAKAAPNNIEEESNIEKNSVTKVTESLRKQKLSPSTGNNSPSPAKKKPTKKETPSQFIDMARQLALAVQKNTGRAITLGVVKEWARSFRLLHDRGVPNEGKIAENGKSREQRMQEALDWHCDHMGDGDRYIPIALCGKTFREKYFRIEAAMKRKPSTKGRSNDAPKINRKGKDRTDGKRITKTFNT